MVDAVGSFVIRRHALFDAQDGLQDYIPTAERLRRASRNFSTPAFRSLL
jgi:hypothetical protein